MFPRLLVLFFCVMILNLAAKPKFTKRLIGMCTLISTIGGQLYVRRYQGLCLCQRSISTLGAPPIYRKRLPEVKQPAPERDARKMI